jgi:uncharacterized protein YbcI
MRAVIQTATQSTPPPGPAPASGAVSEALNNGLVVWFKERTGRGPQRCQTSIRGDNVLVVLRSIETPIERTLVDAGQPELVKQLRRTLCEIDRGYLSTLVSSTIGRPVQTMLSDHDPASDTSTLVFLLERES